MSLLQELAVRKLSQLALKSDTPNVIRDSSLKTLEHLSGQNENSLIKPVEVRAIKVVAPKNK